jgi:glutamate-1-semialdehyde aminotransferase
MPHRVGLITAEDAFIQAIYKWTRGNDSLLVFDEVITYRSSYGGAQEWYKGVTPDLTAMGKMIGGGFPVGALAGRADVMDVMDPLASKVLFPHSGTFSANPITMTAGLVSMEMFDQEAVIKLNKLADYARNSIREAINLAGVPACVSGAGSMYRIHMKENVPNTYREGYVTPDESALIKTLLNHMFDEGIMMINTCSGVLSTVMTEAEIAHSQVEIVDVGSVGAKVNEILCGRADIYLHNTGFYEWDVAAPYIVAQHYGLIASHMDGAPVTFNHMPPYVTDLAVSRADLHPLVLRAIKETQGA